MNGNLRKKTLSVIVFEPFKPSRHLLREEWMMNKQVDQMLLLAAILSGGGFIGDLYGIPPPCDNSCRMRTQHIDNSAATDRCLIFEVFDCYYCRGVGTNGVCFPHTSDDPINKPRCSADEEIQRSVRTDNCNPSCDIPMLPAPNWYQADNGTAIFIEGMPKFTNYICKDNAPPPGADPKGK